MPNQWTGKGNPYTRTEVIEEAGYEVLVFAATGAGGRAMETVIESGLVSDVLDLTTTELADGLVGGVLTAGPDRMDAAGIAGVPAVIMIPTKAVSVISAAGQPLHDPAADEALFSAIRRSSTIPVEELDEEINSPVFAKACAEKLLNLIGASRA